MNRSTPRPRLFIGSSTEGLPVAKALQVGLDHTAEVTIWSQGVFGLSHGTLDELVRASRDFDYAILVLTQDDLTQRRGTAQNTPRDNVIFELGLFMGALGRERTFIVYSRDLPPALPSDLAGVTAATYYAARSDNNLGAALGPACTRIEEVIARQGVSSEHRLSQPRSDKPVQEPGQRATRRRAPKVVDEEPENEEQDEGLDDEDNGIAVYRLRDSMLGDAERGLSAEEVATLSEYSLSTVRAYLCGDRRKSLGDAIREDQKKREKALAIITRRRQAAGTPEEQVNDESSPDDDQLQRLHDTMLGDYERGLSLEEVAKLSGYSVNTVRVYLSDHRRKLIGDTIRGDEKVRARALAIVSRRRRKA